jgi:hypothetical protein
MYRFVVIPGQRYGGEDNEIRHKRKLFDRKDFESLAIESGGLNFPN